MTTAKKKGNPYGRVFALEVQHADRVTARLEHRTQLISRAATRVPEAARRVLEALETGRFADPGELTPYGLEDEEHAGAWGRQVMRRGGSTSEPWPVPAADVPEILERWAAMCEEAAERADDPAVAVTLLDSGAAWRLVAALARILIAEGRAA